MKNNLLRNMVIAGVLCAVLVFPSFVMGTEVLPVPSRGKDIIPISLEAGHWAKAYTDRLWENYDVAQIFSENDLDHAIMIEDFQNLVRLTIDQEYNGAPDAATREAVVHAFASIWAQKAGKDLESIPVIKMLIYSDTDRIDAKYRQGITVAYMRDIAKGKGAGVFDPKAYVTYGELAVLLYNTNRAIQNELNIADQGFETRGSYEIKDDKVVFDFELVNHHTEAKRLKFGSGQQFELTITDEKGQEVYRYSDGKFFTMALVFKDINPEEALKWQYQWDMTNKEGEKLTSGEYKAQIKVLVVSEENDEKIEADQLTTVMNFSLNGLNRAEVEKAAKQFIPEGASFSIGDLDGDGTLEMASVTRTDAEVPLVDCRSKAIISPPGLKIQ